MVSSFSTTTFKSSEDWDLEEWKQREKGKREEKRENGQTKSERMWEEGDKYWR